MRVCVCVRERECVHLHMITHTVYTQTHTHPVACQHVHTHTHTHTHTGIPGFRHDMLTRWTCVKDPTAQLQEAKRIRPKRSWETANIVIGQDGFSFDSKSHYGKDDTWSVDMWTVIAGGCEGLVTHYNNTKDKVFGDPYYDCVLDMKFNEFSFLVPIKYVCVCVCVGELVCVGFCVSDLVQAICCLMTGGPFCDMIEVQWYTCARMCVHVFAVFLKICQ
jgi:hypothetical protein